MHGGLRGPAVPFSEQSVGMSLPSRWRLSWGCPGGSWGVWSEGSCAVLMWAMGI